MGRVGCVDDIAQMAIFLADKDKAGWITGQKLLLDGGRLLGLHGLK